MRFVIPLIEMPAQATAQQIKDTIINAGAELKVDSCNWPAQYPYTPEVSARLAADHMALYVLFTVRENHIRVATLENNGPVWEDSCVEIFIMSPDGQHYTNLEMNAAGTFLAASRTGRDDPRHFNADELSKIKVTSSLPSALYDQRNADGLEWNILAEIPFVSLGFKDMPAELKMNLYKCGDKTDIPHFLSYAPIGTEQPDFHRPEYFADFIIK